MAIRIGSAVDTPQHLVDAIKSDIDPCLEPLTQEEKEAVVKYYSVKTYKKGTVLLSEGQIARDCYYIVSGCIRQYYLVDGEEKTTSLYKEEQTVTATISSTLNLPSQFYLECLEETTMKVMNEEQEKALFSEFPRFETLCRVETERLLLNHQETFAKYIRSSPKERYLELVNNSPDLLMRVPQYHLASYIGVKPESLSRIRKRLSQEV